MCQRRRRPATRPLELARETLRKWPTSPRLTHPREAPAASSDAPAASYVAVDLTPSGTFKYVLLSAVAKDGSAVQLVHGYAGMEYHADVFDAALPAIEASGLTDVTCTGGGRIRHDAGSKLFIYGYSLGFGRADHGRRRRSAGKPTHPTRYHGATTDTGVCIPA